MGGVLTSVLGGGGRTTEKVEATAETKALDQLRLQQLQQLFGITPYSEFAGERPDIYSPGTATQDLMNRVSSNDLMSVQDYIDLALNEGKNYISQVATPQIMQSAALQGLEGGGYVPEAIGKATAGIALPFLQSLPNMQQSFVSSAQGLFPITDFNRALREADLTRRQGVVTTGLAGIPFQPETTTHAVQKSAPLFNFFGQGQ